MRQPRLVFVLSPYQNAFFAELAQVFVAELGDAGVAAMLTTEPGSHVVEDDDVFVLLPPHEYVALEGARFVDDAQVAARSIGLSAEQPHQSFFESNVAIGARLGRALDFSPLAVERMNTLGVSARRLRFGYTSRWDRFDPTVGVGARRGPGVLYLGNKHPRRLGVLATAADALARHRGTLLVSDNEAPNRGTGPTFVAGATKRDLLAATRLLVNVHQSAEPYFEWLRVAEAAHCGTPVLSEHSIATDPFRSGTHFASFDGDLGERLDELAGDDDRLDTIAAAAYAELRRHPLADGLDTLVDAAAQLLHTPPPAALPRRTRTEPIGRPRHDVVAEADPPRPSRWTRWRRADGRAPSTAVVVAERAEELAAHLRARVGRVIVRQPADGPGGRTRGDGLVVVAPAGTVPIAAAFDELVDRYLDSRGDPAVALATGVLAGAREGGEPTLEGCWPWESWRLAAGQHLGRLVLTRARIAADAAADPRTAALPLHLAIEWWAARRGMVGVHLPRPVAHVTGVALDPTQPAGAEPP